jgi:hypothetical protein
VKLASSFPLARATARSAGRLLLPGLGEGGAPVFLSRSGGRGVGKRRGSRGGGGIGVESS